MNKAPYEVRPDLLEALFDTTNMEIVKLLQERPMSSGEVAATLALEDPDAIEQLDSLVRAGVVRRTEDENGNLFELTHTNYATIADLMDQTMRDRLDDDQTDTPEEPEPTDEDLVE